MTKEQIQLIKQVCLTDDGTGNPKASVFTVLFNDEISFRNTDDFVVWDDENELVSVIRQNLDGPVSSAAWPYKISTGFFGNIQFLEGLYTMSNFEKVIDELFLDKGLIDAEKKEMIMTWAKNVRNHALVPRNPGPYYPTCPQIPPHPPVPEIRPDGIFHCAPIDQRTKMNFIYKVVDKAIEESSIEFTKIRPATYKTTVFEVNTIADEIKKFIEAMGKDLFYATYTDNDVAAIYNPHNKESIDNFTKNAVELVLPSKKGETKVTVLYIEAFGVRVHYSFTISYINDDAADKEWIENTTSSITGFVESINSPAIDSIVINNDYSFSAVINTTDGLDIGLTEFLASLPNTSKVVYTANGRSYTLTVGYEPSYQIFKEGVLNSMPTENGAEMTGTAVVTSDNAVDLNYTLKVKYFNEAEAVAKIGDKYYSILANAFAAATSGQTIDILKDVTIDNTAVNANSDYPVLAIADGVTVNGNSHTITAGEGWVKNPEARYGTNHIMGISAGTATINDLTVVGSANCKSGLVCYGTGTNVTLSKFTAKNCGNCGIQVAGATVAATDLNTSGNAWGAVNVDKGSDGSMPAFTLNSGTMAENVEVYTEITDQDVITAPSLTKVQGYGATLKGFIYYTSDVSKLGSITGEGTVFETLADVVANNPNASVALSKELTEDLTVPAGANLTIDGKNNTIHGAINCTAIGSGATTLTLKDMTLTGDGAKAAAIMSQNQTDNDQMECNIILNNVTITGYTNKAIYGTNIKTLTINGGTVSECATGPMGEPNISGDYAIDLNLIAVQGTVVNIDGTTFTGDLGDKAIIKVTQRGGESDAGASDIPKGVGEAKVESVTITNCNFTGATTDVDFRIGTDNKTVDNPEAKNTTGAYAASLKGNTDMNVFSAYLTDNNTLVVPEGREAAKTSDGDIALVDSTSEVVDEEVNNAIESIVTEGVTVEPDPELPNTYSITTNGALSTDGLIDQVSVIENVTGITVTSNKGGNATYTTGEDLAAFKSQVNAMLPTLNEDEEVVLTMTVKVG